MATTDITTLLSSLGFPNPEERMERGNFSLFPNLPTELRLKIWTLALPLPTILALTAHILLSDPTFGFFLTFFNTADNAATLITLTSRPTHSSLNMNSKRSLPLLQACKESRNFYLKHFPIALPFSIKGQGKLHLSPSEVVHLTNFSDLIHNHLFQQALRGNYRLQTWWDEIPILAIPITSLIVRGRDWEHIPTLCRRMKGLREIRGVMWERFRDVVEGGDGVGMRSVVDAMGAQLRSAEGELGAWRDGEGVGLERVPEIRLMI